MTDPRFMDSLQLAAVIEEVARWRKGYYDTSDGRWVMCPYPATYVTDCMMEAARRMKMPQRYDDDDNYNV